MKAGKASEVRTEADGGASASVSQIYVNGLVRTVDAAVGDETARVLSARTLRELIVCTYVAAEHLQYVGLFDRVTSLIDVDRQSAAPNAYNVYFICKEPRSFNASLSVGTDNLGEAEGTAKVERRNAFGRGEDLHASATWGVRGTNLFDIRFKKPVLGWQRYRHVSATVFRNFAAFPWSNYSLVESGATLEGYNRSFGGRIHHSLRWNGAWRQLQPTADAPFEIREQAGHSVKSSVESILAYNSQNDAVLPSAGSLVRHGVEWASPSLGGDVGFVRNRLDIRSSTQTLLGLILSAGLQLNYVTPTAGRNLHMGDRVYLGGATNLRGFNQNAVGPIVGGTAADDGGGGSYLGGMGSWTAAVHVYRPLIPAAMLFLHGFAVAGNLHRVQHDATIGEVAQRLLDRPRGVVGVGLVVRLSSFARIEVNYCHPISFQATDGVRPGVHFGIGTDFL